ncbi:MAG: OsmC family protein [Pseudomonadales bacterium]|nr:OsmC family protein [Pseudomonadales bacterium]MBO6565464.1 OsmC family protein [Pseudomonadales bacterium]MBO6597628.1 OsmC family protein [Pseudomonadales bacterium]MBO6703943.1 OsmC family protein [Pseudomonadales bacterium]MBO6823866.1 OsmC family protein [Pseudomonadales bacterium]
MKATVRWIDDVMFLAESGSGHTVTIDGPESEGGRNIGIRPMELMLMGMGGCTSFDVMKILRKSRQPVEDCVAQIEAKRADEVPSVFTHIHIHFVVTGKGVKEAQVKRAIELSAEKYCSASIMLGRGGVNITHDYEIVES